MLTTPKRKLFVLLPDYVSRYKKISVCVTYRHGRNCYSPARGLKFTRDFIYRIMKTQVAAAFLLLLVFGYCQSKPYFKDIDYKLNDNELDTGVAIDSIFEIVPESSVGAETKKTVHRHRRSA